MGLELAVIGSWNGSVSTFPLLVRDTIIVSSSLFIVFSRFSVGLASPKSAEDSTLDS